MKNHKTNSKHVKELIKKHIIECVYNEDEKYFEKFEDAAKELHKEFKRVANHPYNLKKFPNNVNRFNDYLRGLPFNFLCYDDDIKDFLNSLGINNENKEYPAERMRYLYALLIYREIEKF